MKEKIYINLSFDAEAKLSIEKLLPEYQLHFGNPNTFGVDDAKRFLESDFVFGWCEPDLLVHSTKLRWVQLDSVGYGQYQNLNWENAAARPRVTNLRYLFADFVAETVIAGLLSHFRGVQKLIKLQQTKTWDQLGMRSQISSLKGKSVLIVGIGGIGQSIKRRLENFNCDISTYGNSMNSADIISLEGLDKSLAETDVVVICLPENVETIGLFDSARLHKLKKSAVIVNVGRGSVLNEEELIRMLSANEIAFAILDVTSQEPIPANNKLWDLPNVLLTQHTGGGVGGENHLKLDFFLKNLQTFKDTQELMNEINIG